MKWRQRTSVLVMCIALVFCPDWAWSAGGDTWEWLDRAVEDAMPQWHVPGLALAVVQDDQVVYSKGFGLRDIERPASVTPETIFAIGSASKAFTATALGMLVDEGRITWTAPVSGYLPYFQLKDPWISRHVNLLDLLSHRTGLKGADVLWVWQQGYLSRRQLVESMRHEDQAFPFRSQWHYNNLMILAAGQVIAAVTGHSWDAFVANRIFAPLGMTASNTSVRDLEAETNVARPHLLIEGTVKGIPYRNIDAIAPAGAINSNVRDLVHWLRFQLNGCRWQGQSLVQPETVHTIRSPHITMPIPYPSDAVPGAHFLGYGLCWFLHDYHGVELVEHGGNIDGMTAMVALIPEKNIGLAILTNLGTTRIREVLLYTIADKVLGRPARDWNPHFLELEKKGQAAAEKEEERKRRGRLNGTLPSLPLDAYAGTYNSDQMGELVISNHGGGLRLTYQERTVSLSHWHLDTFRMPEWNIEEPGISLLNFTIGPDGYVSALQEASLGRFIKMAQP